MPRIRLFGSGPARYVNIPLPQSEKEKDTPTSNIPPPRNNQRATFAALRELKHFFKRVGVSEKDYWDMKKDELKIESRTEINEETYAILSAELNLAKRDRPAFQRLVNRIREHKENKGTPCQANKN